MVHEVHLAGDIALRSPADLSLAHHVYCFIALAYVSLRLRWTEPLTRDDMLLDEPMILLGACCSYREQAGIGKTTSTAPCLLGLQLSQTDKLNVHRR